MNTSKIFTVETTKSFVGDVRRSKWDQNAVWICTHVGRKISADWEEDLPVEVEIQGFGWETTWAETTDPEALAKLAAREAEAAEARAYYEEQGKASHQAYQLERLAKTRGEVPDEAPALKGEVLLDTSTPQGTGSYWVLTDDTAWFVQCYGMDGDNWGNNNIGGGIAYKLAATTKLVAELRRLHAIKERKI